MGENISRILHVVSAMNRGGTETLLMNIYRAMDRTKVQFDFVSHRQEKCDYDDEIEEMGGHIYRIPSLGQSGPVQYVRNLKAIIKSKSYLVVHSHTDYQSGFTALAAKLAGVKKRVCHAHTNSWLNSYTLKQNLTFKGLQTLIGAIGTDYWACSEEAGRFLFGDKKVSKGVVQIMNNGINLSEYTNIPSAVMKRLKDQLNLSEETTVIGHVGNFSEVKNQVFIIDLIAQLKEERKDVIAILVGEGPLKQSVREYTAKLGLSDSVQFLGVREDIPVLMKLFDVFVFPSLYEGFGMVTLEAQGAGTPCIVSNRVPKTTDLGLGLVSYLSLEDPKQWISHIQSAVHKKRPKTQDIQQSFDSLGFNIYQNVKDWLTLYGIPS